MIIGLLFWALALLSCAHAAMLGGRDGRRAALLILAASVLTIPATRLGNAWGATELGIFAVDVGLLVGLYSLMLSSNRYWPIWMTGFHLIAVATHLSTILAPGVTPKLYRAMESVWAVPVLLSMVIGIELDRWGRRRAARG